MLHFIRKLSVRL